MQVSAKQALIAGILLILGQYFLFTQTLQPRPHSLRATHDVVVAGPDAGKLKLLLEAEQQKSRELSLEMASLSAANTRAETALGVLPKKRDTALDVHRDVSLFNRPPVLRVAVVMGTRPEIVKLSQVIYSLRRRKSLEVVVILSGQHQDLMIPFLAFFNLTASVTLDTMKRGQNLASLTAVTLSAVDKAFEDIDPDVVIVQGDTTTALTAALAAFYRHIPIAHVEAGLRTWDLEHPFPEEANRQTITALAWRHYAPTYMSQRAVLAEGVSENSVLVTGNTGIDAMLWTRQQLAAGAITPNLNAEVSSLLARRSDKEIRVVLLTAHRRENHDGGLAAIFRACGRLLERYEDVYIVFPVHPNPLVQQQAQALVDNPRVLLQAPFNYQQTAHILGHIDLLMTDSGGLQEESTVFSVPTLVLRTSTEREEGIVAGVAVLVGNDEEEILKHASNVLDDVEGARERMSAGVWPYGLGEASEIIARDLDDMTTHTRRFRQQAWLPDTAQQTCEQVLSIILPVHNGFPFLRETWESIQRQSSPCWSLIIVDDGSTDGSSEYLDQLGADPRVKIVVHKRPGQRLPAALNSGLPFVDTAWVTWTSADNNLRPDFVRELLNAAKVAPEATLITGKHVLMDDQGVINPNVRSCDFSSPYHALMAWSGCTAFAWSKAVGDVIGEFDTELEMVEDWDYWIRLLEQSPIWVRIPSVLYDYRLHAHTMTSTKDDKPAIKRMGDKVIARHAGKPTAMFPGARLCAVPSACRLLAQARFNAGKGSRFAHITVDEGGASSVAPADASDFTYKEQLWFDAYQAVDLQSTRRRKLVIVPSDPMQAYVDKGREYTLTDYYNPLGFFDEVYLLSPQEHKEQFKWGMHIIPTKESEFQQRLDEIQPDAVRAYGGYWACDLIAKMSVNAPLICSVHDTRQQFCCTEGPRSGKVETWSMSEAVSEELLKFLPRSQVWGFTNRIDFDIFKPITNRTRLQEAQAYMPGKRKLLHVGRRSPEKNGETVVRALALLPEEYGLTMIGPGSPAGLESLIKELGLQDRVKLRGALNGLQLAAYYSGADAFVAPSLSEGFGIVFIEALGSGALVVTSDIGPMNEFITHGHNGVLVQKNTDPKALASAIRLHVEDDALSSTIRGNARASVNMFRKELVDRWEIGLYRTSMFAHHVGRAWAITPLERFVRVRASPLWIGSLMLLGLAFWRVGRVRFGAMLRLRKAQLSV